MKEYFYFQVFRKTIIQFLDAFNDIKVARYTPDGSAVEKYVTVPIKLATKEKFWYWYNERKDDEMLPMITAWISSIDWATDRTVNNFFELCISEDSENLEAQRYLHPCPYNLGIQMQVWSLHMVDIDQIMEQILPFFCPNIFIRIKLEELGIEFDDKIVFRSATPEVSYEIDDDNYRVINYTLDFEIQTWFFKPIETTKLIGTIYGNLVPNTDSSTLSASVTGAFPSGGFPHVPSIELIGDVEEGEKIITYNLYEPGLKETNPT